MMDGFEVSKRFVFILSISFVFILSISFTKALLVENGTSYDDGCYEYVANRNFSVDAIEASSCDLEIDGLPFCTWGNNSFFDTDRACFDSVQIFDSEGNLIASTSSSGSAESVRAIRIGSTSTVNVDAGEQGDITYVWISIWQNVISGTVKYMDYLSEVVSGTWEVDVPIGSDFDIGSYNYTIYSNTSSGAESNVSGAFDVDAPRLDSVSITSSLGGDTTDENLITEVSGLDPEGAGISYQWYRNGEAFVGNAMRFNYESGNVDSGADVELDSSGNIYVTGSSLVNSMSLFNTIKYNQYGEEQWVVQHGSESGDYIAHGIAIDSSDNIYVAGSSYNGADDDFRIVKYDSSGEQAWSIDYDGGNSDVAYAIAIDSSDNIYVAGSSYNGADDDFRIVKYDSSGEQVWSVDYDGGNSDVAHAIAIDSSDNVYVTGESYNGDTGDFYTIKYDSSGEQLWSSSYDSESYEIAYAIAVGPFDNVYVAGSVYNGADYDLHTIKYDSSGEQLWGVDYDGGSGDDNAYGVAVDDIGNVYVAGESHNGQNYDSYLVRYESSADETWDIVYDGGMGDDTLYGVATDSFGNVYVAGEETGGDDENYLISKYTYGGAELDSEFTRMGDIWSVIATVYYYDNIGNSKTSNDLEIEFTCLSTPANWEISMDHDFVLDEYCDLSGYNITFTGSGSFTVEDTLLVNQLKNLSSGMTMFMGPNAIVSMGEVNDE